MHASGARLARHYAVFSRRPFIRVQRAVDAAFPATYLDLRSPVEYRKQLFSAIYARDDLTAKPWPINSAVVWLIRETAAERGARLWRSDGNAVLLLLLLSETIALTSICLHNEFASFGTG